MNIKEASEKTGVSSAAIRYYEKESLIPRLIGPRWATAILTTASFGVSAS